MTDVVTDSMIGSKVQFLSKAATDETEWVGTVQAVISYAVAKKYGDAVSYHGAVKQADALVPLIGDLSYFLISLDEVPGTPTKVFASEWIATGTLEVINERVRVTVELYDLAENSQTDILTILRANGYKSCRIVSVES